MHWEGWLDQTTNVYVEQPESQTDIRKGWSSSLPSNIFITSQYPQDREKILCVSSDPTLAISLQFSPILSNSPTLSCHFSPILTSPQRDLVLKWTSPPEPLSPHKTTKKGQPMAFQATFSQVFQRHRAKFKWFSFFLFEDNSVWLPPSTESLSFPPHLTARLRCIDV